VWIFSNEKLLSLQTWALFQLLKIFSPRFSILHQAGTVSVSWERHVMLSATYHSHMGLSVTHTQDCSQVHSRSAETDRSWVLYTTSPSILSKSIYWKKPFIKYMNGAGILTFFEKMENGGAEMEAKFKSWHILWKIFLLFFLKPFWARTALSL
jgi:hypothetical protein